jgi:hypothetical protein
VRTLQRLGRVRLADLLAELQEMVRMADPTSVLYTHLNRSRAGAIALAFALLRRAACLLCRG